MDRLKGEIKINCSISPRFTQKMLCQAVFLFGFAGHYQFLCAIYAEVVKN